MTKYRVGTRENPIRQSTAKSYFVCEYQGELVVEKAPRERCTAPMVLGSIGHRAIELLHLNPDKWGVGSGTTGDVMGHLLNVARADVLAEPDREPLDADGLKAVSTGLFAIQEQVENYIALGYFDRHQTGLLGVEVPWRAKIGRWWCKGTIDMLWQPHPGLIELTDFKTGIRSSERNRALDPQLALYALGMQRGEIKLPAYGWTRLKRYPDRISLFETKGLERYKRNGRRGDLTWEKGQLKGRPEVSVYKGARDFEDMERQIDEMGARLNNLYTRGARRPTPLKNGFAYGACFNCPFAKSGDCDLSVGFEFLTDNEVAREIALVFAADPLRSAEMEVTR